MRRSRSSLEQAAGGVPSMLAGVLGYHLDLTSMPVAVVTGPAVTAKRCTAFSGSIHHVPRTDANRRHTSIGHARGPNTHRDI
jgi:hypothetical protein